MQPLSYGLQVLLAIYQATGSAPYLNDAILITENIINRSRKTKRISGNISPLKDRSKGWIDTVRSDTGLFHLEIPLSESYFFQYVAKLLLIIHNRPDLISDHRYFPFYRETLEFVEKNIWDKWEERGETHDRNKYTYLFRSRTHMASHWAYMGADLSFLTKDSVRRSNYLNFVNLYNQMLEKNFKRYNNYISWNSTWDYNLNGSSNNEKVEIQDVSHANLVVSYLVEAYDLGLWKDFDAIQRIINTLKDKLWDPKDCIFRDNIDGTMFQEGKPIALSALFRLTALSSSQDMTRAFFQSIQNLLNAANILPPGINMDSYLLISL